MNTQPSTAPTIQDYHRKCIADYVALPRRSCLGAGQCPECGADPCECVEGELIPVLAEMHARFAKARIRVDALR